MDSSSNSSAVNHVKDLRTAVRLEFEGEGRKRVIAANAKPSGHGSASGRQKVPLSRQDPRRGTRQATWWCKMPHQGHLQASGKIAIQTAWGTVVPRWRTSICPIRGTYMPQANLQSPKNQFTQIGCHTRMHCGNLHTPQPKTKYIDTIHSRHTKHI